VASYRRQGVGFRGLTAKGAAARMGLDTPSWPNSEGMRPVFIDCGAPAGTSRAFPKFESYGMLEMAASVGRKVKDAIVWFHGIGRLGDPRPLESGDFAA